MVRIVPESRHSLLVVGTLVLVALGSSGATAVSMGTISPDPLRLSMADASDLSDVHVERRSLNLSSGDIVGVTTAINNSQLTDLSVDVTVRLEQLDGTVVEEQTTTVLLGSASVTLVELSLDQSRPPTEFAAVNVTVTPSL